MVFIEDRQYIIGTELEDGEEKSEKQRNIITTKALLLTLIRVERQKENTNICNIQNGKCQVNLRSYIFGTRIQLFEENECGMLGKGTQ